MKTCLSLPALLDEKVVLREDCFLQVFLPEIRTGSFSKEFRRSDAKNKFRTGSLTRILNDPTEHTDLPGHCKHLSLSLLRKKK